MGRVRTKTVKRAAKVLLERHYQKLTSDFHINKRILSEVAKVPTKRLRNKIAGFATHLVKRIQKGPVKGISLKVQQEQRERRLDWVPKQSEIKLDKVNIDSETKKMLAARFGEDFVGRLSDNLQVKTVQVQKRQTRNKGKTRGDRKQRAPRENREKKERKQQQPADNKQQDAPKREGRKRGNRDGQDA